MPTEQATRFLVAGWWLVSVIVSATYTGNLIAALAVPRTVLPVQTLEDLAKQTTYTYGPVDGTAIYSLIKVRSPMTMYPVVVIIYLLSQVKNGCAILGYKVGATRKKDTLEL